MALNEPWLEYLKLTGASYADGAAVKTAHQRAKSIIESIKADGSNLAETLSHLLTAVVKPSFSTSRHPKLTSTGRKNLLPSQEPQLGSFAYDPVFDDPRPWKNSGTHLLLKGIVQAYGKLDESLLKRAIENDFYLLVPPTLHLIDDSETQYKVYGLNLLQGLSELLLSVRSDMFKRTGLTDVFIEAMQPHFLYLPTLTPEDEALLLHQAQYPAFYSLIAARFQEDPVSEHRIRPASQHDSAQVAGATSLPRTEADYRSLERDHVSRNSYLTMLLRHSLLYSLSHLSTATGAGTSMSIPLSTFFVSQIAPLVRRMRIYAVRHLEEIVPIIRNILVDPFSTSAPGMIEEAIGALESIVQTCRPRIQDRWWAEVLRAIVGCWMNIVDDMQEGLIQDPHRRHKLVQCKEQFKALIILLEDTVGEDLTRAKAELVMEEPLLEDLLNRRIGDRKR